MRVHHTFVAAAVFGMATASLTAAPAGASLAWGDDPCEEYGGQLAVAPDNAVPPGATHPYAYVACADGSLLYHGADGPGQNSKMGLPNDSYVDVASGPHGGLYAVTTGGRVVVADGAVHHGAVNTTGVVALETTRTGNGYWMVMSWGRVEGFGDAPDMGPQKTTKLNSPISAFAASSSQGGWVVTQLGQVVPVGNAPALGSVTSRMATGDKAVGIVADTRSGGYWVVTQSGDILEVGGAPAETDDDKCRSMPGGTPPFSGAVGDPRPDASAPLWTYSRAGGICGFNPYA